jgi:hypothetical protein
MLLQEMFSPLGGPKEQEKNIDWGDDLKFYIDNEDRLLQKYMFPAVEKHEKYVGHPNAYKIYMKAIRSCAESYCEKFEIEDPKEKFTEEIIEGLARRIAVEQEKYISKGDYKKDAPKRAF